MIRLSSEHPFAAFRNEQKVAIESCIKAINSGIKYVILEAPTGSGKSAIAVEILRNLGSGRILTPQVVLQTQYVTDYPEFKLLKGASRYGCHNEGPPQNLGPIPTPRGQWMSVGTTGHCGEQNKWFNKPLSTFARCRDCNYLTSLEECIDAKYSILNYHSFYFQNKMRSGAFNESNLVLDEAHNLNKIVTGLFERTFGEEPHISFNNIPDIAITFSNRSFQKEKSVEIIHDQWVIDFFDHYIIEMKKEILALEPFSSDHTVKYNLELYKEKLSQANFQRLNVNSKLFNYRFFEEDGVRKLTCTPMNIKGILKAQIFDPNKVILFMSATILDSAIFCKEMGLDVSEVFHCKVPDSFDAKKHKVIYVNKSEEMDMSYSNRASALPALTRQIGSILENHSNEKGIIHSQNFAILNKIVSGINSPRLTYQDTCRGKLLKQHKNKPASVLIAPGMKEGVNFPGDESTFQIIVCVPFPVYNHFNLCKFISNPGYKEWITTIELIQSLGRSIRTTEDTCVTYLLDARFGEFIKSIKGYLSAYQRAVLSV